MIKKEDEINLIFLFLFIKLLTIKSLKIMLFMLDGLMMALLN